MAERPRVEYKILICVLGSTIVFFLWIAIVLPLFEVSVGANNLNDLDKLFLYLLLYGATPLAAFPALFLFGPGKKSSNP